MKTFMESDVTLSIPTRHFVVLLFALTTSHTPVTAWYGIGVIIYVSICLLNSELLDYRSCLPCFCIPSYQAGHVFSAQ